MPMQKSTWFPGFKKFMVDLFGVFLGVSFAFMLSKWNENRNATMAEQKMVSEIKKGLKEDLKDIDENTKGTELGIESCKYFKNIIIDKPVNRDSFIYYFHMLTRDFISIQNTSAYESLKSRGMESLADDSLRWKIIKIYDIRYETLKKLQEEYGELQFHNNYFSHFQDAFAPFYVFNERNMVVGLKESMRLSQVDRNKTLHILFKMAGNRMMILAAYKQTKSEIEEVIKDIEKMGL